MSLVPLPQASGVSIAVSLSSLSQVSGSFVFFFVYTVYSLSGNSDHLTQVRLQQPQEQRYTQSYIQVHAGSFRVCVIHGNLTWTAGSLTCVRDLPYAFVYTRELGTPTASQHIFDSENLSQFVLVLMSRSGGIRTSPVFLDTESDAVPTEPPRHPGFQHCSERCPSPTSLGGGSV